MDLARRRRTALEMLDLIYQDDPVVADRIMALDSPTRDTEAEPDDRDPQLRGPGAARPERGGLEFDVTEAAVEGATVVVRVRKSDRRTARPPSVPPTGRAFAQSQIHVFQLHDGKVVAHRTDPGDPEPTPERGKRGPGRA